MAGGCRTGLGGQEHVFILDMQGVIATILQCFRPVFAQCDTWC